MSQDRLPVCPRAELRGDMVKAVALPRDGHGRPREALVLLGSDGEPRAYLNRCRHLPVPIDGGSKQYLTRGGEYLLCGTHGALYRRDDGMCIAGPCLNLALEPLTLVEEGGMLHLLVP
ncbi:MAG: Ferredoxin subunit of nitrite reductase and ring-hydroxylating dioxygenase [Myxococcaceae bacterium]|nr:Ferredoxin subunit of nitrite reductase and ring-hydroxylating dioxygenase [Myxococcaceae bacterium]